MPEGVLNVTPKAGDVVIISELVTHGALSWVPEDRDRRFLTLRYMQQHESVRGGLDPLLPRGQGSTFAGTLELASPASFTHTKEIVTQEVVTLS